MLHHLHDDGEEEAAPVTVCVVAKVRAAHEPSEARRGAHSHSWGQSVKAIVAFPDSRSATPDELIEHCRTRIASYKKPRSVEIVDALPRQGLAIDYPALDERFGGGGYPGTAART
jgi:acyl-CoA synthetase (AMP-forming)/AMP-acid ligase II